MSKLKIYKASAGSGKTFTLTKEVIMLLFENPFDYKNILAVTFTNKATAEMKNRILTKVYDLWKGNDNDYVNILIKKEGSAQNVSKKASLILFLLLHDFSRFSISTIDSFFQKIIRSFAQELGLQSNFKTELNNQKILQLAIDRLIMKLGQKEKKNLKEWLIQTASENMEQGLNWNLSGKLYDLGKQIFSEKFQSFHRNFSIQIQDKKILETYKENLKKIINNFETTIKKFGSIGLELLNKHQLTWDDFKGKSKTPLKYIEYMKNVKNIDKTDRIKNWINNIDEWQTNKKDNHLNDKINSIYNDGMNKLLADSISFIESESINYFTAIEITKQFNSLGIINDISLEIDEICREDMIYLLANSNKLLKNIIDNNDTPFIYEKSGNTLKHFMIDEFQDTSGLQWENFKPLIDQSLASNCFSLLVGDVKQSIYRWRNSNWELLAHKAKNDFLHQGFTELNLDTNWRSFENIITFNNSFFKTAADILQNDLNETLDETGINDNDCTTIITNAYADVKQKTSVKNIESGGEIKIEYINSENDNDYKDITIKKTIEQIEKIVNAGYKYKNICILVRKKDEAKSITNALLSGNYSSSPISVVSNESLTLSGSIAVNIIISQIKVIIAPDNNINNCYISLYNDVDTFTNKSISLDSNSLFDFESFIKNKNLKHLKGLPLLDLIENLIQLLPEMTHKNEGVFIQALIDFTSDYIQNNGADPANYIEWWDNEGKNKTIQIPEEQDAIRVMTIHKSKGLEFDIILMPFLSWELDDAKHQEIIWCEDPFNELSQIPVQYSKNLLKTYFNQHYITEHIYRYVDNLNMLYVAFTRAKKGLFGYAPYSKGGLNKVSDLLFTCITNQNFKNSLTKHELKQPDDYIFQYGELKQNEDSNKTKNNNTEIDFLSFNLPLLKTFDYSKRISIVLDSSELILSDDIKNQINKGKIMHHAFELIKTTNDIEKSVNQIFTEGLINETQVKYLKSEIAELLTDKRVNNWFKPGVKIINETSIITKKGTYIPDRVVIDNNSTIVIDYKFGEQHSQKHFQQVNNYVKLLKEMNYKNVKGYIWYVFEKQILETNSSENLTLF
ncbi:MAG: UvrD-helicase domain-containing protein [Marinilabiliaceae bacterium]|nr:UvrD-helicase domain-containing protein [Marinilabiliaceae bacterium]